MTSPMCDAPLSFEQIKEVAGSHFFVQGTDTDAGKSIFTWQYVRWLHERDESAIIHKPAECEVPGEKDSDFFCMMLGEGACHCSYSFDRPVSPHFESRRTQTPIDFNRIAYDYSALTSIHDNVVVEGAGGILCPLSDGSLSSAKFMADLNAHLNIPAVLVVRNRVGCLNHTLLSIEALEKRDVTIAGIVVNGHDNQQNIDELPPLTGVPVLAVLPWKAHWER